MDRVCLFLLCLACSALSSRSLAADTGAFTPGRLWLDDKGLHINAHGGGVLFHEGTYYWFGEHKVSGEAGNQAQVGVHVYASEDLYTWRDEGIALSVSDDPRSDIARGCVLERPKVIYNAQTKTFVMWFHLELKGQGYDSARSGVAVAKKPAGPYTFLHSLRPNAKCWPLNVLPEQKDPESIARAKAEKDQFSGGVSEKHHQFNILGAHYDGGQMARDMTLFVDDDGRAYHVFSSEHNSTLHIARLSDDYLSHSGEFVRVFPNRWMEAPAICKRQGKYYLIASGCTGWAPNAARAAVADSIFGPWKELGNPCRGTNPTNKMDAEKTFGGQSTYILPVQNRPDAYIAMFDLWRPDDAIDGRYIWLPMRFTGHGVEIEWQDQWDFSSFDQASPAGTVVVHPSPPEEPLSGSYRVWANDVEIPVLQQRVMDPPFAGKFDHGGPYALVNFDCSGPVKLRVESDHDLSHTVIRPQADGIPFETQSGGLNVSLPGPCKLSIESDGKRNPLLVFVNPPEENAPAPTDANVVYFGPGIHKPGRIDLASNQTLYLAGGAVVKASVSARGENITIRGRGILDGNDWEWRKGPRGWMIHLDGCTNARVQDILIRGSWGWTLVPQGCNGVTIRNVKICNGRVQNDDGINPCNSQNVLIDDCFIRTDDDCIAMKGLDFKWANNNVENITIKDTLLWCDRARIFLLGHESRAEFMRNIRAQNLDILHYTMTPFLLEPGEEMHLTDAIFENIHINGEGQESLIRLRPVVNRYMKRQVPGHISNITFNDIGVKGQPGDYRIELLGADADHNVREVHLQDLKLLGKAVEEDAPNVRVGPHAEKISFGAISPR